MSMIHFIGGEKGGVGKSVMSRLLSQYFLDQSMPYLGMDADQSHPTLSRYYKDYTRPVNLDYFEGADQIMELALQADQQILVDLPAQSQRFLNRWIEDNGVIEMADETSIPIIYWYVVDDGRDSVQLLKDFLSQYGDQLRCVVVKNYGCGSDFSEIDDMLNEAEATYAQISLPALHANTIRKIDKLNFSFRAAANINSGSNPFLSLMERQRTKVWLKKAYASLSQALFSEMKDEPAFKSE